MHLEAGKFADNSGIPRDNGKVWEERFEVVLVREYLYGEERSGG